MKPNQKIIKNIGKLALKLIEVVTNCKFIGLRIKNNGDFPYIIHKSFSKEFLKKEMSLLVKDSEGRILRDDEGKAKLACMCGKVIKGQRKGWEKFSSKRGTFWRNSLQEVQNFPDDLKKDLRGTCIKEGFESIAVIPVHPNGSTIGLMHICDKKAHLFSKENIRRLEQVGAYLAQMISEIDNLSVSEASKETKKILIVEDERMLTSLLERLLKIKGYKTSVAYNAFEAIDKINNFRYDLVIADINLPGKSGIELIKAVKEKYGSYGPRFLVITGTDFRLSEKEMQDLMIYKILPKPYPEPEILFKNIERAIQYYPA